MGNLKCSCLNNKENGQFIFEKDESNTKPNLIIQDCSLFEIIKNFYNSKNIEIEKINQIEFDEMLNSNSDITKLLEDYNKIFDEHNINFNLNNDNVECIKFKDKNKEKESSEFYYYGEFNNNGIIDGVGIKIINKNYIYKGEFSNGEYHGKGLLIKNMAIIFGDWEFGEINGNVIYKVNSKFEYNGNFEKNKKNGFGSEKYQDGSIFEGNFVNNKKNGHGIYTFPNGEKYEGNFEDDLFNGEGQYIWEKSGKKYIGQFKNGKIEGKGTYTYEDGTKFIGTFIDGYKNGEGCIIFPDGKKYFGNWLNDDLYGNGYLLDGKKKIEIIFRHGKIISQKLSENIEDEIMNLSNNKEIITDNKVISRFNANSFYGDKNIVNIDKYICFICKYFLIKPFECTICRTNYCQECIKEKKCLRCKNEKFKINKILENEIGEIIKIKCDKCQNILNYKESLEHFH